MRKNKPQGQKSLRFSDYWDFDFFRGSCIVTSFSVRRALKSAQLELDLVAGAGATSLKRTFPKVITKCRVITQSN